MKRKQDHLFLVILNTVLIVSMIGMGVTYAWFPWVFDVGSDDFIPGPLDKDFSHAYWNKASGNTNKWKNITLAEPVNIDLGEMVAIDELPTGTENYFKFRMNEINPVQYTYEVILQSVDLAIETIEGPMAFEDVHYYDADPSQKVFNYYYVLSTSDNLDPTVLFANPSELPVYQIATPNQHLTTSAILQTEYLYVMVVLRLKEIQNMVDRIPIAYSPYSVTYTFSFMLEKRTIDEI